MHLVQHLLRPSIESLPWARDVEVFFHAKSSSKVSLSNRRRLFRWMAKVYAFTHPYIRSRSLFSAFHLCDAYVERSNSGGNMEETYFLVGCASLALASALFDSWPLSNSDFCWIAFEEFSLTEFEQAPVVYCPYFTVELVPSPGPI